MLAEALTDALFLSHPQFVPDSLLEGSGFELPVPRCALIANSAALVAPPDSAVSGSSLNGRLTTPIGGGPETASADPPRGSIGPTRMRPRKLGKSGGRWRATHRFGFQQRAFADKTGCRGASNEQTVALRDPGIWGMSG